MQPRAMRTAFHSFLPNGPLGDPVVRIDLSEAGHSLLLDLGDLRAVSSRKLLRVRHALVSHTHLDHFVGFEQLLRVSLARESEVALAGPPGFIENVAHKLGGYTWNLVEDYPIALRVTEVGAERVRSCLFRGANGLRAEPLAAQPFDGTLVREPSYRIDVASFDHGIPVLGFAMREIEHLAVNKDRLDALGLETGPWLRALKDALRVGVPADAEIEALAAGGAPRRWRVRDLAGEIILRQPGQGIGYLTDLRCTPANVERAVALVAGVDLLVCEAAFLHEDARLARERNHLTARQAGELARAAGAQRLAPFHVSSRYEDRVEQVLDEAARAFGGPVIVLPREPVVGEPGP
jgi:ribonuclease Z